MAKKIEPLADFHSIVAELTGLPRRDAKDVNFAKCFGAGKKKFASMTGMTEERAAQTMDQYDEEMWRALARPVIVAPCPKPKTKTAQRRKRRAAKLERER